MSDSTTLVPPAIQFTQVSREEMVNLIVEDGIQDVKARLTELEEQYYQLGKEYCEVVVAFYNETVARLREEVTAKVVVVMDLLLQQGVPLTREVLFPNLFGTAECHAFERGDSVHTRKGYGIDRKGHRWEVNTAGWAEAEAVAALQGDAAIQHIGQHLLALVSVDAATAANCWGVEVILPIAKPKGALKGQAVWSVELFYPEASLRASPKAVQLFEQRAALKEQYIALSKLIEDSASLRAKALAELTRAALAASGVTLPLPKLKLLEG